jgi:hypothetical protein
MKAVCYRAARCAPCWAATARSTARINASDRVGL